MTDPSRVDELQPGDHACLTFSDVDERLDLVAAFIRDGLRLGDRVLCITDSVPCSALHAELAGRGLPIDEATQAGRLHLATSAETYLAEGSFAANRMLDLLSDRIEQARSEGYRALRIAGDMSWALRPVAGVDELMTYESQLRSLLADGGGIAICQYDRRCFDPVTLAGVTAAHELAVAAVTYHDDALLRICRQYVPGGLRVAGELDYRAVAPLTRALTESLSLDEHVHVNLTQLAFIDVQAAGALLQAALSLATGQRMVLRCRPLIHKVLRTLGADEIPQLDLVISDDE
ncbi:STAS domain-containing protein [Micromonospora pattaloongensis]|uniref:STAS domain-containing protein n=1 Tax=Micromonospora pattaloongensis TaxID=405436 RepID=A0A1H3HIJ6_9ACTN|nr:MEDS domain-containing protein [Micromonospora pattaloongensis]SDY15301.1 STAS domain-containing protein [Micromonospora pattaloongensis]